MLEDDAFVLVFVRWRYLVGRGFKVYALEGYILAYFAIGTFRTTLTELATPWIILTDGLPGPEFQVLGRKIIEKLFFL